MKKYAQVPQNLENLVTRSGHHCPSINPCFDISQGRCIQSVGGHGHGCTQAITNEIRRGFIDLPVQQAFCCVPRNHQSVTWVPLTLIIHQRAECFGQGERCWGPRGGGAVSTMTTGTLCLKDAVQMSQKFADTIVPLSADESRLWACIIGVWYGSRSTIDIGQEGPAVTKCYRHL